MDPGVGLEPGERKFRAPECVGFSMVQPCGRGENGSRPDESGPGDHEERGQPGQRPQTTVTPSVKLNVELEQYVAASRYQHW